MKKIDLLDVTLRDGGYLNAHKFSLSQAVTIVDLAIKSNIDFVEIGYFRPNRMNEYSKEYPVIHCPPQYLEELHKIKSSNCKYAAMVHPSIVSVNDIKELETSCVDIIRVVVSPKNIHLWKQIVQLVKGIKSIGLQVSINIARVTEFEESQIIDIIKKLEIEDVDYIYIADSNSNLTPDKINRIYSEIFRHTKNFNNIKLGFHGHNALGLGFINSLTSIDNHVVILDASILGIGKSGGNLRLELISTYLNLNCNTNFNLGEIKKYAEYVFTLIHNYTNINNFDDMISAFLNLNEEKKKDIKFKNLLEVL